MPVNIKVSQIKYKDANGNYVGINGVSERATAEEIAEIEAKGAETIASIPDDYTALSNEVDDLKSAFKNESFFSTWELSSNNKRLFSEPKDMPLKVEIVQFDPDYEFYIQFLDATGSKKISETPGWLTSGSFEMTKDAPKFRVGMRKKNEGAFSSATEGTDTLFIHDVSVNNLYDRNYEIIDHIDNWEMGTINGSTGNNMSATARLRTKGVLRLHKNTIIECTNSYRFCIEKYTDFGVHTLDSEWKTGYQVADEVENIRLVLKKNSGNDDMSVDEAKNVKIYGAYAIKNKVRIRAVSMPYIGDSIILKFENGQTAVIDLGHIYDFPLVKNALIQEGITKIDYLIITHYHDDHATKSGVQSLISNFNTSSMIAILPPDVPQDYDNPEAHTVMAGVKEALSDANIPYINTYRDEIIEMFIGDVPFTFYNCDQSDVYTAGYDYNNMSLVCVMKVGKVSVLLTGDMMKDLETKLINEIPDSVTIAKFGHHGWNQPRNVNYDFWRKMKPEVFFSSSPSDMSYSGYQQLEDNSGQLKFANYNGIKSVMTGKSGDITIDISPENYSISGYNFVLPSLTSEEFFDYVIPASN